MAEYIKREAALRANCYFCSEHLKDDSPCGEKCADYMKFMKIPAADVRPVVRGHWISEEEAEEKGDYSLRDACSVCGHCDWDCTESAGFNYCPNCGADMREGS